MIFVHVDDVYPFTSREAPQGSVLGLILLHAFLRKTDPKLRSWIAGRNHQVRWWFLHVGFSSWSFSSQRIPLSSAPSPHISLLHHTQTHTHTLQHKSCVHLSLPFIFLSYKYLVCVRARVCVCVIDRDRGNIVTPHLSSTSVAQTLACKVDIYGVDLSFSPGFNEQKYVKGSITKQPRYLCKNRPVDQCGLTKSVFMYV